MINSLKSKCDGLSKSDDLLRPFLIILLIGALLRVIILPFFGHIDFLSEYSRIFTLNRDGNLFFGSRFITAFTEYIHYFLVSPLLAEESSMFRLYDLSKTTATHLQYFAFVEHHAIYRTFFLLKLPYLLFDLLSGVMLYNFFQNKWTGFKAAAIWLFNPITFFAFHIFGRFESIALFYVVLSLFFAHKNRILPASIAFGLAMWSREINLTLLPFFIVFVLKSADTKGSTKAYSILLLLVFASFATSVVPSIIGNFNQFRGGTSQTVTGFSQSLNLLGFEVGWYYPFVVIYMLLLVKLILTKNVDAIELCKVIVLYYSAFFIMVIHTVHYVSWMVPFFSIVAAKNFRFLLGFAFFCLSWLVFWTFASDLGVFTHWLAIPGSLFFSNIPTIPILMNIFVLPDSAFQLHHVVTALRSIYASALIVCAIQIFNASKHERI